MRRSLISLVTFLLGCYLLNHVGSIPAPEEEGSPDTEEPATETTTGPPNTGEPTDETTEMASGQNETETDNEGGSALVDLIAKKNPEAKNKTVNWGGTCPDGCYGLHCMHCPTCPEGCSGTNCTICENA